MEQLVGAGGWAYFDVGSDDALAAYARAFDFVEVNITFYRAVDPRTVASWRRRVPARFRFAVRAHRDLTHTHRLKATAAARASLANSARLAEKLGAVAVVLEAPATVTPDAKSIADLVGSTDLPCPVALEARAHAGRDLPPALKRVMEANDVADAVDFSREGPRTESSIAYGRMFGLGDGNRWEYTDAELTEIRRRAEKGDRTRLVYAFHGVRMYSDAGRFLTSVKTGKFPRVTRHEGVASLKEILSRDAVFPATKSDLIQDHGWRVIDATANERAHASELLDRLPEREFGSAGDVARALTMGSPTEVPRQNP